MRQFGLRIDLQGLGVGEVIRDLPPEDLLTAEARILGPRTPRSYNLRMYEGALRPRAGYEAFANTPRSTPVNGLFLAQFDNESIDFLRMDKTRVSRLSAGAWSDILTSGLTGDDTNVFTAAMVARAGAAIGNELFFCNGNGADSVYGYTGGASTPTAVGAATFTGVRTILGHRGRALFMNTFESAARKFQRVRVSVVGDPRDVTGTGSGFVDLSDDPYPIANAFLFGGRVAVFKGNNVGGSVIVGTLTGSLNSPYRWDQINTNGIGLLFPRTLTAISADVVFFVGHDAFYVYDGARALQQVATSISRDILSRVNTGALYAGWAWYRAKTGEVHVHLPMGTATTATETWIINIRDQRVYGPFEYNHLLTAVAQRADTGAIQWDSLTGTWDTLSSQYPSWDAMRGTAAAAVTIFGDSLGRTWQHDDTQVLDNVTAVTCEYDTGIIRGEGRTATLPNGEQRVLAADDVLTLHDVTLFSLNRGEWTPSVLVSADYGGFQSISDGSTMGGTLERGRIQAKHYTCPNAIPGTSFQIRVAGIEPMTPHALRLEFTVAGSDRHS